MEYKRLILPFSVAIELPVTDLKDVVRYINRHRRVIAVITDTNRKRNEYQKMWVAKKKKRDGKKA